MHHPPLPPYTLHEGADILKGGEKMKGWKVEEKEWKVGEKKVLKNSTKGEK